MKQAAASRFFHTILQRTILSVAKTIMPAGALNTEMRSISNDRKKGEQNNGGYIYTQSVDRNLEQW
jgi:hypothetical protein